MGNLLWMLLPPEAAALLLAGAGLAMILGLRALAASLGFSAVLLVVLPPLLEPLLNALPLWLLLLVAVAMSIALGKALLALLVGKRAAEHAVAILAADVIRGMLIAPFRIVAGILRSTLRRRRP